MDSLKEGIHLRGYAHTDPLVEYQKESFIFFNQMIDSIKEGIVESLFKSKLAPQKEIITVFGDLPKSFIHSEYSSLGDKEPSKAAPVNKPSGKKVGRNEPCPCGSGKKYKKCCGR
jgi:preprotein translocase subunit SecA